MAKPKRRRGPGNRDANDRADRVARYAHGTKQTKAMGRRWVVGDGTVGRFDDVKQGDLGDNQDGVHATTADRPRVVEEPVAQESERP